MSALAVAVVLCAAVLLDHVLSYGPLTLQSRTTHSLESFFPSLRRLLKQVMNAIVSTLSVLDDGCLVVEQFPITLAGKAFYTVSTPSIR